MIKDIKDRIEVATKTKLYHAGDGDVREDITADWIAEFKEPADAELFIHAVKDFEYLLSLVKKQREALEWIADGGFSDGNRYVDHARETLDQLKEEP